jgi:hypothetical protein
MPGTGLGRCDLFGKSVPVATTGALPHPFGGVMSATLTNKKCRGFGHNSARKAGSKGLNNFKYSYKSFAIGYIPLLSHRAWPGPQGEIKRAEQFQVFLQVVRNWIQTGVPQVATDYTLVLSEFKQSV